MRYHWEQGACVVCWPRVCLSDKKETALVSVIDII